jgi:hypothetical protein
MVAVAAAPAAEPCGVSISTMPLPMVRMIRQPPEYVPSPMASPAASTTQRCGPVPAACIPAATSTRVMTPMVFCPSEVPWASATSDAVKACPYLKPVSLCTLGVLRVIR